MAFVSEGKSAFQEQVSGPSANFNQLRNCVLLQGGAGLANALKVFANNAGIDRTDGGLNLAGLMIEDVYFVDALVGTTEPQNRDMGKIHNFFRVAGARTVEHQ